MINPDFSSVSLIVHEEKNGLKVELHNHRTRVIAQTAESLGAEKAIEILRALLGLCPITQVNAFKAAQHAITHQNPNHGFSSYDTNIQSLVTAEAILETVRVLSMDLQPFTIHGKVSQECLKTLGELRARLWDLSKSACIDNAALESFNEDLKALIILWFTREKKAIGAIKHTFERFDNIQLDGKGLLFPEEVSNREILKLFLRILQEYPEWALSPQLVGARIPGALARCRSQTDKGRRDPFSIRDLVLARLEELKNFASGLPSPFTVRSINLGNNWGVGLVETARGTLMHFLQIDNNKMRFHIVAPTEWAFQEESPMVDAMNLFIKEKSNAVKSVITGLNLIACAFDPCTKIDVKWPQKEG